MDWIQLSSKATGVIIECHIPKPGDIVERDN